MKKKQFFRFGFYYFVCCVLDKEITFQRRFYEKKPKQKKSLKNVNFEGKGTILKLIKMSRQKFMKPFIKTIISFLLLLNVMLKTIDFK